MRLKKLLAIIAMLLIVLLAGCKQTENPGVRPTVASTVPANNATGIAVNTKITATLSVAMDPSTITSTNFTLQQGATINKLKKIKCQKKLPQGQLLFNFINSFNL